MQFSDYTIQALTQLVPEIFQLILKPNVGAVPAFKSGQFVGVTNPAYLRPQELHYFSVVSGSQTTDHLELCFRVYGNWTKSVSQKKAGDILLVSNPTGNFTLDESVSAAVFLAGGVGIVPFMSMLRSEQSKMKKIILIYGSRTSETIIYKNELNELQKQLPELKIVHVLSEENADSPWQGYRGFVSGDILQKEVDLSTKVTFFLCGPPVFVSHMQTVLSVLQIPKERIKQELFSRIEK
jgi:ferredoxin-NADP reductase